MKFITSAKMVAALRDNGYTEAERTYFKFRGGGSISVSVLRMAESGASFKDIFFAYHKAWADYCAAHPGPFDPEDPEEIRKMIADHARREWRALTSSGRFEIVPPAPSSKEPFIIDGPCLA